MRMKLESNGRGVHRIAVIAPVREQGLVILDDGKTQRHYAPDTRTVYVLLSPRLNERDPTWRMGLIERNYALRLEQTRRTIAGRRVVIVVAAPRREGMPERHISVDATNGFVLRHETLEGGQRLALLDTLSVQFFARGNEKIDEVPPGQWRVERPALPLMVGQVDEAQRVLGFRPSVPRKPPLGFAVMDMQVLDRKTALFAMRLSDGLATATVYQWSTRRPGSTDGMRPDRVNRDGIAVLVVGAVPDGVRTRLLDAMAPPGRARTTEVQTSRRR